MKVLALTHGPNVGPGVFGEAVRDAGHELVERQRAARRRARREDADAVLVFGGAMHPDEDDQHGWLRRELRRARGAARATARRSSASASARS